MIKLNINEAKTHLSRHLARVAKGEAIVLCKRNVPIAEIRPLPASRTKKRLIGLAKGTASLPPATPSTMRRQPSFSSSRPR